MRRKRKKFGFNKRRGTSAYKRYYDEKRRDDKDGIFSKFSELSTETKKTIASIFLITFGLLVVLSLVGIAGSFGSFVSHYLGVGFGVGKWYVPIFLLALGYFLARPNTYDVHKLHYFGITVFLLSLNGLIHIMRFHTVSGELTQGALAGLGGGLVGLVLAYPLFIFVGFWGALIIFVALLLISFFLLFNTSFSHISEKKAEVGSMAGLLSGFLMKMRIKKVQEGGDKSESEEGDDDEGEDDEDDEDASLDVDVKEDDGLEEEERKRGGEEEEHESKHEAVLISKRRRGSLDMPITLLSNKAGKPTSGDIKANQFIIKKTLENFNIRTEMGEVNVGPTVTQYTLKPGESVKLSKIVGLNDNLALALASHPIRIEAPIPGRSLVGIEVPNQSTAVVPLKSVLDSEVFRLRKSNLMLCLGHDVKGTPWLADLARMPHILIAGATGSGKSVCINTLIIGLLYQNSPEDLKFIMVDPKRVELPLYNSIPHLLTPVITDVKKTVNALKWAIAEMERRFEKLEEVGKRDIGTYNREMQDRMPYIVIIIDELADLMSTSGPEIEAGIIRLAQMARAVGIHLVVATQRPSVDVLTGTIKANIPARIAFSVASLIDSRTILDTSGAEKLLGRGDMLFMSTDVTKPKRLQGAIALDAEIKNVIAHVKKLGDPEFLEEVTEKQNIGASLGQGVDSEDADPLLSEAMQVIVSAGKASASLLQRRLRVGYARAARILDLLEEQGFIGPADGAKPREVLKKESLSDMIEEESEEEYEDEQENQAETEEHEGRDEDYEQEEDEEDPKA